VERRPDPEPLEINDVALVAGGTVLWAVALVVLLVLKAAGSDIRAWWIQMCGAGVLLGLIGVRTCRRRRASLQQRA
jgi:hypothetical protein